MTDPGEPRWQHPWYRDREPEAQPSWLVPIACGALLTLALHGIAIGRNETWWYFCLTCGASGTPAGLLPAWLALRREPAMGATSAFAVSFIATGIGAALCAALSWLQGFEFDPRFLEQLGETWREAGLEEDEIARQLAIVEDTGPIVAVTTAGLLALTGGVSGAMLAAWLGRRARAQQPTEPGS